MEEKTPRQLAEDRLKLADEYSKLGERLAELKLLKAQWWQAKRQDFKSDASAERAWDLTDEGQEMEQIKLKMKTKEHKISALRTLIEVSNSEKFNQYYRPKAVENNDIVFDIVIRHHARACHIAQEILCLLKSGFSDAAHARWRALHEVNCTAMFIAKHGQECAERFYFHDVVDSYDAMCEHKKHEERLQEKGPSQDEIDDCKSQYDRLVKKYGKP